MATGAQSSPMLDAIRAKGLYEKGPIVIHFSFKIKPEKEHLLDVAKKIFPLVLKEEGCLAYECYRSSDDKYSFVTVEKWTNGDAVAGHLAAPHTSEIREILKESLAEPPVLKFYTDI